MGPSPSPRQRPTLAPRGSTYRNSGRCITGRRVSRRNQLNMGSLHAHWKAHCSPVRGGGGSFGGGYFPHPHILVPWGQLREILAPPNSGEQQMPNQRGLRSALHIEGGINWRKGCDEGPVSSGPHDSPHGKGAFSHSACTARAQRGHSAGTAPIITVIIQVTTLKTTHLRNHAQSIQNSKIQTSDACHGSQGPKFCPL